MYKFVLVLRSKTIDKQQTNPKLEPGRKPTGDPIRTSRVDVLTRTQYHTMGSHSESLILQFAAKNSHKFHRARVRYELGVSIQSGDIVWLNGPFPCGSFADQKIALASSETPNGLNNYDQYMKKVARSRHETVNGRFKQWGELRQIIEASWRCDECHRQYHPDRP